MMKKKESEKKMEKEEEEENQKQPPPPPPPPPNPSVSPMKPLTHDAYGGGIYGTDDEPERKPVNPPASDTQSADGPEEASVQRKQKPPPPPPSTGDRDTDITGKSYIQ